MLKRLALALALAGATASAHANFISTPISVAAAGVTYYTFQFTNDPGDTTLTIQTSGSTLDPELFLFFGTVSNAGFVASSDDINFPSNLESRITLNFPSSGTYIAAIGQFDLTLAEAISGSNPSAVDNPAFTTTLSINARNGTVTPPAAVPVSSTLALLGLGLAGAGLVRRRS